MTLRELLDQMESERKNMVNELAVLNGKKDQLREDVNKLAMLIAHAEAELKNMENDHD